VGFVRKRGRTSLEAENEPAYTRVVKKEKYTRFHLVDRQRKKNRRAPRSEENRGKKASPIRNHTEEAELSGKVLTLEKVSGRSDFKEQQGGRTNQGVLRAWRKFLQIIKPRMVLRGGPNTPTERNLVCVEIRWGKSNSGKGGG